MKIMLLHEEGVTEEMLDELTAPDTVQAIRECSSCANKTWIVFPEGSLIECACCGAHEEFDPQ